jgi:WD40 repeat protein
MVYLLITDGQRNGSVGKSRSTRAKATLSDDVHVGFVERKGVPATVGEAEMADFVGTIVRYACSFEKHLVHKLGASGDGLFQKAKSVKDKLPKWLFSDLCYVAQIRNKAAHEAVVPDDMEAVIKTCKRIEIEFDLPHLIAHPSAASHEPQEVQSRPPSATVASPKASTPVAESTPKVVLDDYKVPVTAICFAPEGFQLAIGYHDGSVQLWNEGNCKRLAHACEGTIHDIIFSPDGRTMMTLACGQFLVWDMLKECPLYKFTSCQTPIFGPHSGVVTSCAVPGQRSSNLMFSSSPAHQISRGLDEPAGPLGQVISEIDDDKKPIDWGREPVLAISADEKLMAITDVNGGIYLYSVPENRTTRFFADHNRRIMALALGDARGGSQRYLAAGDRFGHIHVWDVTANRFLDTRSLGLAVKLRFDKNATCLFAAVEPRHWYRISIPDCEILGTFKDGLFEFPGRSRSEFKSPSLSNDQKTVVVAGKGDNHRRMFAEVLGIPSLHRLAKFRRDDATAIAISPDHRFVATANKFRVRPEDKTAKWVDHRVRIWPLLSK